MQATQDAPPLAAAGAWVLTGALVYAPWAFGSRTYVLSSLLSAQLFVAGILWALGYWLAGRAPVVPRLGWMLALALFVFGWIGWFNPISRYEPATDTFIPNASYIHRLPVTVDPANSLPFTVCVSAYLLVIVAGADLSRYQQWRRRFLKTIAWTGVSVVAGGLILKAGAAPALVDYLAHRPWAHGIVFGPFDYHGNAGCFLNLTLPAVVMCAGLARRAASRAFWLIAAGSFYAALLVNPSRAALVIAALSFPLMALIFLSANREAGASQPVSRRLLWISLGAVAAVLAAAGLLVARGGSESWRRLHTLAEETSHPWYPRYLQNGAAWEIAQVRPVFGSGIGSYKLLVQHSSIRGHYFAPKFRPGEPFKVLSHTKEDYLQTLVEWGGVGFALWGLLVAGAFFKLSGLFSRSGMASPAALAIVAALLGVYVHALVDCPLQIPALQFYAALCLGMAWGCASWMCQTEEAATILPETALPSVV